MPGPNGPRQVGPALRVLVACIASAALVALAPGVHAEGRAPLVPSLGELGVHVVQPGETLFGIAARYGLRADALARLNGTAASTVLLPGRALWVPLARAVNARANSPAAAQASPSAAPAGRNNGAGSATESLAGAATVAAAAVGGAYTVVPGDTLFSLSRRFGLSVDDLKRWNGLPADGSLRAGETLSLRGSDSGTARAIVPASGAAGTRDAYSVAPGDTLASIADRFGTSVASLQRGNHLAGDLIQVGQTLVVPRAGSGPVSGDGPHKIEIDIGAQRMYVWQGDTLIWNWVVSTGLAGYPTRRGTFAVQSKIPNAWSSPWQLWMPHWLGIYWAGGSENGIHALPIINGRQLWAGSLGTPISYGCIVLGVEDAELLYNWAELGTPVVIHD